MSNKKYGLGKEREVKALLYKEGAVFVARCRGSFGIYDIIAFFEDKCILISVKATKQKYYSHKAELNSLERVRLPEYAKGRLMVWYSPNKDREERGWKIWEVKKYVKLC